MPATSRRTRRRHPAPRSPADVVLADRLEADANELIAYLLARSDAWAVDEPPEVLGRLRCSWPTTAHHPGAP